MNGAETWLPLHVLILFYSFISLRPKTCLTRALFSYLLLQMYVLSHQYLADAATVALFVNGYHLPLSKWAAAKSLSDSVIILLGRDLYPYLSDGDINFINDLSMIQETFDLSWFSEPPSPRLVCVETNPGPHSSTLQHGYHFAHLKNTNKALNAILNSTFDAADVPAPMLVGVEVNPGPRVNSVVKAAKAVLKQVQPNQILKTARKKLRKRRAKKSNSDTNSSSRSVSAPVRMANIITNRNPRIHTVPFDTTNVFIKTEPGITDPQFSNNSGALTTYALDLNLIWPFDVQSAFPLFGVEIDALRTVYAKYRVRNLRVSFISAVSTAQGGVLAFGYDPDSIAVGSSTTYFGTVASMSESMRGPTYQLSSSPMTLNIKNLDSDFKYIVMPDSTPASIRLSSFGSIYVAGFGCAPGTTFGALQLTGDIDFMDLVPPVASPNDGTLINRGLPAQPTGPVVDFSSTDGTASAAHPFGNPGPSSITPSTTSYIIDDTSVTVPLIGNYKLTGYWDTTSGAISAPASLASSTVTVISFVANSIAPYDVTVYFTATTPALYVALVGPTGMTAAHFHGEVISL